MKSCLQESPCPSASHNEVITDGWCWNHKSADYKDNNKKWSLLNLGEGSQAILFQDYLERTTHCPQCWEV